jgi:hypothetical protein
MFGALGGVSISDRVTNFTETKSRRYFRAEQDK